MASGARDSFSTCPGREDPSAGFALIEVLVALGVVAVGIVAVLSSQRRALGLVGGSHRRLEAAGLVEDLLGQAEREASLDRAEGVSGSCRWELEVGAWEGPTRGGGADAPSRTVTGAPLPPLALREARITVSWDEGGVERSWTVVELLPGRLGRRSARAP